IGLPAESKGPATILPNQLCLLVVGGFAVDPCLHVDMRVVLPGLALQVLVTFGLVLEVQLGRVGLQGPDSNVVFAVAGSALIDREQIFRVRRQYRNLLHDRLAAGPSADEQVGAALVISLFDQVRSGSWKIAQHSEDEALFGVDIVAVTDSNIADIGFRFAAVQLERQRVAFAREQPLQFFLAVGVLEIILDATDDGRLRRAGLAQGRASQERYAREKKQCKEISQHGSVPGDWLDQYITSSFWGRFVGGVSEGEPHVFPLAK